jgi:hypothetical protein
VKPVLLVDVVHWKCHGTFGFCKEWLLVSRIYFINQLEFGHRTDTVLEFGTAISMNECLEMATMIDLKLDLGLS